VSAEGQTQINASTRYCAVLGHPVKHSASPAMHNAGIAALGLNWRYLAFDVLPDNLPAALAGAKAMKFIGLNLTVPHKLLALEMVDDLDASARQWGAVNTIRFEARDAQGQWRPVAQFADDVPDEIRSKGFNTDADALVRALNEDLGLQPLAGAGVLVLGAGGAGRVAALKLASEGAGILFLVNRTRSKAGQIAYEIRRRFPGLEVTAGYPNNKNKVDLVINATSLGLQPEDELPFEPEQFSLRQAHAVYDLIYRPAETPLLKAAKAAGCRTANGLGMLLHQGAKALEIWSDKPAPLAVMRQALEKEIYRR
jgi:shikimate dehydrogenase